MTANKKIILCCISAFLSFVVLLMAIASKYSLAWFNRAENVKSTGVGVSTFAESGAHVQRIEIFKRNGSFDRAVCVYDSNSSDPALLSSSIQITEYDTVFTERNVNTPVVIRVTLDMVPVEFEDGGTIRISVTCPEGNDLESREVRDETKDVMKSYFSNLAAMWFGCFSVDTSNIDAAVDKTAENKLYNAVQTAFSGETPNTFATVNKVTSGYSVRHEYVTPKNTEISYDVTVPAGVTYTEEGDRKLNLYIKIDYAPDLIACYSEQVGIDVSSAQQSESGLSEYVDFIYDIGSFVIDYQ